MNPDRNLARLPRPIAEYIQGRRGLQGADGRFAPVTTAFILRGLQGSGKSHFVLTLSTVCADADISYVRCNADKWFYYDSMYRWSAAGLADAHLYSKALFAFGINEGFEVLIVDATNRSYSDYKWYADAARNAGFHVAYVEWDIPHHDMALAMRVIRRTTHVPGHRQEAVCRTFLRDFTAGLPEREQDQDPQPLVFQMAYEGPGFDADEQARAARIAMGNYGQRQRDREELVQAGVPHARGLHDVPTFQRGNRDAHE